jgi:hypothetical protein
MNSISALNAGEYLISPSATLPPREKFPVPTGLKVERRRLVKFLLSYSGIATRFLTHLTHSLLLISTTANPDSQFIIIKNN